MEQRRRPTGRWEMGRKPWCGRLTVVKVCVAGRRHVALLVQFCVFRTICTCDSGLRTVPLAHATDAVSIKNSVKAA